MVEAKARRAAEELERVAEAEERKRAEIQQKAERDRIAEDARQRRATARQLEQSSEETKVRPITYEDGRPIDDSSEWWDTDEAERKRQSDIRTKEQLSKSGGARKQTLFDLSELHNDAEAPRSLTQAEFNLLPKEARKSGFEMVKRARPSQMEQAFEEEEASDVCTFLGNCKCTACR